MDNYESTAFAPEGTALAPEGTAIASEGTAIASEGTAFAPEGTALADSRENPSPVAGKNVISSGAEAEIRLIDMGRNSCVKKIYRHGRGPNMPVIERLSSLKGKGYVADVISTGKEEDGREFEMLRYYPDGSVAGYDLKGNSEAIMHIVIKAAVALDACHKAGVLHRDIKPANILVADENTWDVVLCDFGIGELLGENGYSVVTQDRTPTYGAPEIYDPRNVCSRIDGVDHFKVTPAADFYSLGFTALALWSGESAIRKNEASMAAAKLGGEIRIPKDMDRNLAKIVSGLIQPDPCKRWGIKEIQSMFGTGQVGQWKMAWYLNPLMDLRFNNDVTSETYIKTEKQLGAFFQRVYDWQFCGAKAPARTDICRAVVASFDKYQDSILELYFGTHSAIWGDWEEWIKSCLDWDSSDKEKMIAPHERQTRVEISMMKVIAGLTGSTPTYLLPGSDKRLASIDELRDAGVRRVLKDALKNGLKGWIAVQYQESVTADFSAKYSYERKLAGYLEEIGRIDSSDKAVAAYHKAQRTAMDLASGLRKDFDSVARRSVVQKIVLSVLVALTAVLGIVEVLAALQTPGASEINGNFSWICVIAGIAVFFIADFDSFLLRLVLGCAAAFAVLFLIAYLIKFYMWVFAALIVGLLVFEIIALVRSICNGAADGRKGGFLDFETQYLEPLDYAFKPDGAFDSSLNQYVRGSRSANSLKYKLNGIRKNIVISAVALVVFTVAAYFFPKSDKVMEKINNAKIETIDEPAAE